MNKYNIGYKQLQKEKQHRLREWLKKYGLVSLFGFLGFFLLLELDMYAVLHKYREGVHCSNEHFVGEIVSKYYYCNFITNYNYNLE